jgi:acetyl-CoA C-acetyltransferase
LQTYVRFLLPRQNPVFGKIEARDSLENDGLLDAYDKVAMGNCAELCAERHDISRESLDAHAIESYKRAERAWKEGAFDAEVVPVVIKGKKGDTVVKEDEEYKKVIYEKVPTLKSAFKQGGRITAANSSSLNDGASALILMSAEKAKELGVRPLAKIICEPVSTWTSLTFRVLMCIQHMLTVVWSRNTSLRHQLSRFPSLCRRPA